jgi:hypothetical protein
MAIFLPSSLLSRSLEQIRSSLVVQAHELLHDDSRVVQFI